MKRTKTEKNHQKLFAKVTHVYFLMISKKGYGTENFPIGTDYMEDISLF